MDDNTVTVFAVDSRGNQKDKTKSLDIVEYLMDIVIQLEKSGEETKAIVKKSRIGNLPKILEVKNYSSIEKALNENNKKQLAKDSKE